MVSRSHEAIFQRLQRGRGWAYKVQGLGFGGLGRASSVQACGKGFGGLGYQAFNYDLDYWSPGVC